MLTHRVTAEGLIEIETNALKAQIKTTGYTSGVAAGTLIDKRTMGAELGFGLDIADFLLEPGDPNEPTPAGQYQYGNALRVHGDIPKRYVEGPQICTQARRLPYEIIQGPNFLAVQQWYTWHQAYAPYRAGSKWEQTLIFLEDARYFLSADRITSANDCPSLIMRTDLPGHIRHQQGNNFEHIYLSYEGSFIPSTEFETDFGPDEKYLYRRSQARTQERMIRAYQIKQNEQPTIWLAGMTLNPDDVYEAWCHQRGYVCMIQEIGGRRIRAGETFGAAYAIGWFDDYNDMRAVYDRLKGPSGWDLKRNAQQQWTYEGVTQANLSPVTRTTPPPASGAQ